MTDESLSNADASKAGDVLTLATGLDDLLRSPVNRYLIGTGWLVFVRPTLSGVVLWGRVDVDVLSQIAALMPVRYLPPATPQPTILDVRFVESVDPRVLDARDAIWKENASLASAFVTRVAILNPPGLIGAIMLGIGAITPSPFPEDFFTDPEEALRWLGAANEMSTLAEVERLRQTTGATRDLQELRSVLDTRRRLPLASAARAVGLSARSLQRRLADAGTSYQHELTLATVRIAQRLLLEPGAKVAAVAFEVACASPQHLNTLFRKVLGETPSAWRARQLANPEERG